MLVLSRRQNEEVAIPGLGIIVKVLAAKAGLVKVGVEAPPNVRVLRGEVVDEEVPALEILANGRLPQDQRHRIRNHLNAIGLGLNFLQEAFTQGAPEEEIAEALTAAIEHLHALRDEPSVQPLRTVETGLSAAVIEDQPNERAMLSGFLRLRGHDVVCFEDGEEAWDYYDDQPAPGAFLIDMQTPRWGGAETVRRIREDSRFQESHVFVISGSEPEMYGFQRRDPRIDRWFLKPIEPADIANALIPRAKV